MSNASKGSVVAWFAVAAMAVAGCQVGTAGNYYPAGFVFDIQGGDGLAGAATPSDDGGATAGGDSSPADAVADTAWADTGKDAKADVLADVQADAKSDSDGGGSKALPCNDDSDCPSADTCWPGVCSGGLCAKSEKSACCTDGACCDAATASVLGPGTPCGETLLAVEYQCLDAVIVARRQFAGCDGSGPDGCSDAAADLAWTPWKTVAACPAGSVCVAGTSSSEAPTCSGGGSGSCVDAAACDDGNPCTQDLCNAGACSHAPLPAGSKCGSSAVATAYQCSSSGDVQKRDAFAGCTAAGLCSQSAKVWGSWKTYVACPYDTTCEVTDPSVPGTCIADGPCKPGTTCCTASGDYAAKATPCGTFTVKTEYQCSGSKGGTVQKRVATSGCSGMSSSCSSIYPAWGPWQDVKTCAANQTCTAGSLKTSQPVCKSACAAGTTCCTKTGELAAKGTQCSSGVSDTEYQCSSTAKGGSILQRKGYGGCTGESTTCSTSSANLYWGPWATYKTCAANEKCVSSSASSATCQNAGVCSPSSNCCTAEGTWEPKGTACGSTVVSTEYQCSGTQKGAKILQRKGYAGCTGSSTSCSSSSTNLVWSAWSTWKTCSLSQVCQVKSPTTMGTCVTP